MSFLVTRPLRPVPSSCEISTPCSCAILRTSGLDFVRRNSSAVAALPSVFSTGFSAGGGGGGGGAAACGGGGGGAGATGCGAGFSSTGFGVGACTVAAPSPSSTATT